MHKSFINRPPSSEPGGSATIDTSNYDRRSYQAEREGTPCPFCCPRTSSRPRACVAQWHVYQKGSTCALQLRRSCAHPVWSGVVGPLSSPRRLCRTSPAAICKRRAVAACSDAFGRTPMILQRRLLLEPLSWRKRLLRPPVGRDFAWAGPMLNHLFGPGISPNPPMTESRRPLYRRSRVPGGCMGARAKQIREFSNPTRLVAEPSLSAPPLHRPPRHVLGIPAPPIANPAPQQETNRSAPCTDGLRVRPEKALGPSARTSRTSRGERTDRQSVVRARSPDRLLTTDPMVRRLGCSACDPRRCPPPAPPLPALSPDRQQTYRHCRAGAAHDSGSARAAATSPLRPPSQRPSWPAPDKPALALGLDPLPLAHIPTRERQVAVIDKDAADGQGIGIGRRSCTELEVGGVSTWSAA